MSYCNYFLDTEFYERGYGRVDLISIALVCDDGREYYAVAQDGWTPMDVSPWLRDNVVPFLPREGRLDEHEVATLCSSPSVGWGLDRIDLVDVAKSRARISQDLREFMDGGTQPHVPRFWGYFADYDWVLFCQLFGTMMDLPKGWPMFCLDLKQEMVRCGVSRAELPKQSGTEHNALADARWVREAWGHLNYITPSGWRQ